MDALPVCMSRHHFHAMCLLRPEGTGSSGIRVTDVVSHYVGEEIELGSSEAASSQSS